MLFYTVNSSAQAMYGVNLAGAEFGGTNIPGTYNTHYVYPSVSSLDYYNNKGLKLIRLPFLWERIQPTMNSPLNTTELGRMDAFVAGAKARGMYVILDVHNYARRTISGIEYMISSPEVPRSNFVDFWSRMADHFKDDTTIWAYGIMNEPHNMSGTWYQTAQDAITGIRLVDTLHNLLIPGTSWSSAENWPTSNDNLKNLTDPRNKIIYEAHQYFDGPASGTYTLNYDDDGAYPNIGLDRVTPFVNWLILNNKKGFLGEYGVPGNDPRWNVVLNNFLAYLKNNCVGGTYWAGGPWWGSYPLSVEPSGGVDKPQMNVLENYLSCTGPVTATSKGTNVTDMTIYPNPAKTDLTIQASFKENMKVRIIVSDVLGKSVLEISDASVQGQYTRTIDISELKAGCYCIRIISGDNFQIKNFIKN
jgi:endoglucanase